MRGDILRDRDWWESEEDFQIKISLYCVAPVANVFAKDGVIYQDKKQRTEMKMEIEIEETE